MARPPATASCRYCLLPPELTESCHGNVSPRIPFAPPPLFEFSKPSLLAPLKAQVGLIHDRYNPKHPADGWLPRTRTQPPLRSSGLGGNSSPLASTLVTLFGSVFKKYFFPLILYLSYHIPEKEMQRAACQAVTLIFTFDLGTTDVVGIPRNLHFWLRCKKLREYTV